MGILGKWLKVLVGLKKREMSKLLEADKNVASSQFPRRRKKIVETDNDLLEEESTAGSSLLTSDAKFQSSLNSAAMPVTPPPLQVSSQSELDMKEDWAATVIQTVFRALLARRALRALKGLVRLQALFRGYAVRKQAAITLHCMQALVRIQARVRARQVRMSLENQFGQQKIKQQLSDEARVRETEEGWCDGLGSVEEIQAKLLKRQEAAVKRERALAYALSHQWQAGSRQRASLAGFEPDQNNWGWSWLERWMAVRPWESRFLDVNLKDGVKILDTGSTEGKMGTTKIPLKQGGRKHMPATHSNVQNQVIGLSQLNRSNASFSKAAGFRSTYTMPSSKSKPRTESGDVVGIADPKTSGRGLIRPSDPKQRHNQQNFQARKRLSLPDDGGRPRDRAVSDRTVNAQPPLT